MTVAALMLTLVLSAPPTPEQKQLLTVFRKEFIHITPGKGKFPKSFSIGREKGGRNNERPVRKITFGYSFHVAKYEVPQNLWEAVMGSNPSRWKGKRNSVELLNFDEAKKFCKTATKMMRQAKLIKPNQVIRLPSEAEWEYVARAGTKTVFSFGDDPKNLTKYGWYTGNAAGNDPKVGEKKPNPWGLYDIHGYLWEWCTDIGNPTYEGAPSDGGPQTKPSGTEEKRRRVLRGGSWKDKVDRLTSSYRMLVPMALRDDAVGLRCILAKEIKQPKKKATKKK